MIYNPQFPYIYPQTNINIFQIQEEIKKLSNEITLLKKRISSLEQNKNSDYLKKDDNFYIM